MRLLAFSDLHGHAMSLAQDLVQEHAPDWIVLLGDILPDFDAISGRLARSEAQTAFWQTYASNFERNGAVTTFVRGNHEAEGFKVPPRHRNVPSTLANRILCLEGIPIHQGGFGFPREMDNPELEAELDAALDRLLSPRIVLSHAPPLGCLDAGLGNPALREWLGTTPTVQLVLCGHVHHARGAMHLGETLIVNVAKGFALLEDEAGPWRLRQLGDLRALEAHRRFLAEDL